MKDQKSKSDQTHVDNTQRLVKQLHILNSLLQKAKEERDGYYQEVLEKERALEVTLIHLTTAQVSKNLKKHAINTFKHSKNSLSLYCKIG